MAQTIIDVPCFECETLYPLNLEYIPEDNDMRHLFFCTEECLQRALPESVPEGGPFTADKAAWVVVYHRHNPKEDDDG